MKTFSWWLPHNPDNIFYKMWIASMKEGTDKQTYHTLDGAHVSEIASWTADDKDADAATDSK